jgi:nucleoid-associated protein YgaU
MHKDFKIGLIVGLILVIGVIFGLSTRRHLSLQTHLMQSYQNQDTNEPSPEISEVATSEVENPIPADSPNLPATLEATAYESLPTSAPVPLSQTSAYPVTAESTSAPPTQSSITPQISKPVHQTTAPRRYHTVQPGETLSGIAQHYYGSAVKWWKILAANHDILSNPNKIRPGMRLVIPD